MIFSQRKYLKLFGKSEIFKVGSINYVELIFELI